MRRCACLSVIVRFAGPLAGRAGPAFARQPPLAAPARAEQMMSAILAQNAGLRTIARPKTTSRGPDETITAPAAFVSPLPFSAAMEGAETPAAEAAWRGQEALVRFAGSGMEA